MKLDLDELERKAKAATPGRWGWGMGNVEGSLGRVNCLYAADADRQRPVIALDFDSLYTTLADDTAHIAANSPPVTLALLQRILELEHALESALHTWNRHDEFDTHEPYRADLQRVLERGAVLP